MEKYFNVALFGAIFSWITAQVIKTVAYLIKYKKFNPERIFGAGGMPSSHSATVCSLAVIVSRVEGYKSMEFALAIILAFIVMYDAAGVRRAAGLHAREINKLRMIISDIDEDIAEALDDKIDELVTKEGNVDAHTEIGEEEINEQKSLIQADLRDFKKLKEYLGHTPLEVIFGALLGMLIGISLPLN